MGAPVDVGLGDLDLRDWIRPGEGVVWSQHCAEPVGLVDRPVEKAGEVGGRRGFPGTTWRDVRARPEADAR